MLNDKYSLTFSGKKYRINLDVLNKVCLIPQEKVNPDREITEAYEIDDGGEFRLTSKINREITDAGNAQDNMFIYDFIKTVVAKLLDCGVNTTSTDMNVDFGFALAFNTLLHEGIIEEITEKQ